MAYIASYNNASQEQQRTNQDLDRINKTQNKFVSETPAYITS